MRRQPIPGLMIGAALLLVAIGSLSAAAPLPTRGTIVVSPADAGDDDDAQRASRRAVSQALGTKGFTILDDPGHAAYVADVTMTRADVGMGQAKVAAGRPVMMGTGVSVPFATGQSRLVHLQRTTLEISIRKRGDQQPLWHGGAVTVRSDASPDRLAAVLGEAALRSYPQQATDMVGVP